MPAQYTPYNFELNQLSPDKRTPSSSVPFDTNDYKPSTENIDKALYLDLINKYRNSFRHEVKDDDPFDIEQLADVYFLKGDYPKAEKYFAKVIRLLNSYLPAYDKVIQCLILQLPKEAEYTNKSLTESIRNKIDVYYKRYLIASDRRIDILHNYVLFRLVFFNNSIDVVDACLKDMDEILVKQPNNFAALDTKGFIYLNYKNNINDAIKWFKKSLEIKPNYEHALNNYAVCLLRTNKTDEAEKIFQKITSSNPNYTLSYENLGYINIAKKNYQQAVEYLEQITRVGGNLSRNGLHNLAWLYGAIGSYNKSIDLYLKILQAEPNNYLIMNNLGTSYSRLNDNNNAKKFYDTGIKTYKHFAWKQNISNAIFLFFNSGRLAINDKDLNKLNSNIQDIEKLDPDSTFNKYLRATYALLTKNYEIASSLYKELIQLEEFIPDIYAPYSFLLSAIEKDWKTAVKILVQALSKGLGGVLIDNNLAYAYLLGGDLKNAERILEKYSANDIPNVIIPTKGMLEIKKGNIKEGEAYYMKALLAYKDQESKDILKQILLYEKAQYYSKTDKNEAVEMLEEAQKYGESYMSNDIDALKKKLMKH